MVQILNKNGNQFSGMEQAPKWTTKIFILKTELNQTREFQLSQIFLKEARVNYNFRITNSLLHSVKQFNLTKKEPHSPRPPRNPCISVIKVQTLSMDTHLKKDWSPVWPILGKTTKQRKFTLDYIQMLEMQEFLSKKSESTLGQQKGPCMNQ